MSIRGKNNQLCQYWSKHGSCSVRSGGIFIPQDSHISTYCTTPEFPSCLFFKNGQALRSSSRRKKTAANRRKYLRYRKQLKVNFDLLNSSGNIIQQFPEKADTFDLSLGGMQLCTREPLIHESIISFNFGETYPAALQACLARVKWCRYSGDGLTYTVGISFQNNHTAKAIRSSFDFSPN